MIMSKHNAVRIQHQHTAGDPSVKAVYKEQESGTSGIGLPVWGDKPIDVRSAAQPVEATNPGVPAETWEP